MSDARIVSRSTSAVSFSRKSPTTWPSSSFTRLRPSTSTNSSATEDRVAATRSSCSPSAKNPRRFDRPVRSSTVACRNSTWSSDRCIPVRTRVLRSSLAAIRLHEWLGGRRGRHGERYVLTVVRHPIGRVQQHESNTESEGAASTLASAGPDSAGALGERSSLRWRKPAAPPRDGGDALHRARRADRADLRIWGRA